MITAVESNPPDKKLETGTSLSSLFLTLSSNSSINSCSINFFSSKKLDNCQYLFFSTLNLSSLNETLTNSPGFTFGSKPDNAYGGGNYSGGTGGGNAGGGDGGGGSTPIIHIF